MTALKPFKALRPTPEYAAQVSSVPYDVISTEEAREAVKQNPLSFLRVIRSEVDFPAGQTPSSEVVHEKARENLQTLIEQGVLVEEEEASLYIYRLQAGDHVQSGIVGCSSVDDYEAGLIKVHEKTRPDKEEDRTKHMLTLEAQPGPVFLTYKAEEQIASLIQQETATDPLFNFEAADGVVHTIWRASETEALCSAFKELPCTYIADGHHRAASAARCRKKMMERNPEHHGTEAYNFFLTVIFPDDELRILAYNRIIRSCSELPSKLLEKIGQRCHIQQTEKPVPEKRGDVCMYLKGAWYSLPLSSDQRCATDAVEALDVSILQREILEPLFGITDPRTDGNIDFIGGTRGTTELERLVDSEAAYCAFSLFPVSIAELICVADQNQIMAPKCTWFDPKLRSGLFIHRLK